MKRNHGPDGDRLFPLPDRGHVLNQGRARRMLLTSAGIRNEVPASALAGLVGRPFGRAAVAVIPAASVAAPGDHG